jgi:hypothetical protein
LLQTSEARYHNHTLITTDGLRVAVVGNVAIVAGATIVAVVGDDSSKARVERQEAAQCVF